VGSGLYWIVPKRAKIVSKIVYKIVSKIVSKRAKEIIILLLLKMTA
jgi:hypothetical protein